LKRKTPGVTKNSTETKAMSKIRLNHARLDYVDNGTVYNALNDLNLSVEEGEAVSIIGSSGCGKSTVLNVMCGILPLTLGEFLIDEVPVHGPGRDRGIVFQHYSLFPWMTSKKNVSFGIKQTNIAISSKEVDELARQHLQRVGLEGFENKYPFQLSGGMQQRVAIARTLAMKPDILLMDEPFGAIDAKNRVALQDLLLELLLLEEEKKTLVFVTHDVDEAILLSDRMLFMHGKKIEQEIAVNFPKPRKREEIVKSDEYRHLRDKVMHLFFRDVLETIGGNEVVI
jgi:NitT/TauT family transport system ATP-binding protein